MRLENMEIDDLITLKFYNLAIEKINQLEFYDFFRYKALLYLGHFYIEESISHTIEMWKYCDNIVRKLDYYLLRGIISHRSHRKDSSEKFLQKFEDGVIILKNGESVDHIPLLIKFLELQIDINQKDPIKRKSYIDKLFNIAPEVVKYQYEIFLLSYSDEKTIKKSLYPLIEKYDMVDLKPLSRELQIRDLLSTLFIEIGDDENAIFQLEAAMKIIGDGRPDVREIFEIRLAKLTNSGKNPKNHNLFVDAHVSMYSKQSRVEYFRVRYERNEKSYIITSKGKIFTYAKKEWYLVAHSVRSVNKADWEREQRYKVNYPKGYPMRRNQQSQIRVKLIDAKIQGFINIGKGELVTLRGPMGSGKSEVTNYLLGVDIPENGEIFIDGTVLGELEGNSLKNFRNNNIALAVEGKVVLPKNINQSEVKKIEIVKFINHHPQEIITAVENLKKSMDPIDSFLFMVMAVFKLNPKLILMNEPFMNLRGELLKNWLIVIRLLAKHHQIPVVLETHHAVSSYYADCQFFIRDHKIIEILESFPAKIE